jgi:methyl-accepting chemotaxis protein
MEELAREQLVIATDSVQAHLESLERHTFTAASALRSDAELILLINAGNQQAIWQHAYNQKRHFGVNEIIISGANGLTLARSHVHPSTHNPEGGINAFGDDISGVPSVAAALRGDQITLYTPTPTASMVMTSTSPIMDGGRQIGGVVVNFTIGEDAFLDDLAEKFAMDATVFNRTGESVSSTLIHPVSGARAVGTVARYDIVETVIGRGQHMPLDLNVFGFLPYYAYYFPLPGADGTPNGMFFVGISQVDTFYATDMQIRGLILTALLCTVLVSIALFVLISGALSSLKDIAKSIEDVTAGRLNTNLNRDKIAPDEVGMITADVCALVDVVHDMVQDLSNTQKIYNMQGDMKFRLDVSKYQNSFKEVMESINSLLDSEVANITDIVETFNQISEGNFDVKINEMRGDFAIQTQAIRSVIENLNAVYEEVGGMIDAAVGRGDMNFQIDTEKYNGDWRKIMKGLNEVAAAVNAPIIEIRDTMTTLAEGQFTGSRVKGDYKGDFAMMSNAVNQMIESFNSYMEEIISTLSSLAEGDLTKTINRAYIGEFDALKQPINNISAKLNKTMADISSASAQVLSGARQISASASDLASGASTQASSVQELNASVDLINQQTKENAENARKANDISNVSTENAREGNDAMHHTLDAMNQIKDASGNISKIIKTIQDIAFQTNLLALNAAVEAARAGEHGKGFAVVAEEVRNLAARSQQAAGETTTLIGTSISTVESGAEIARSTAETLDTIVENANKVLEVVSAIASSSQEQAEAISQIVNGIGQISQVVQSNSAVSQETAAASQELSSQAELLQQLVSFFKL